MIGRSKGNTIPRNDGDDDSIRPACKNRRKRTIIGLNIWRRTRGREIIFSTQRTSSCSNDDGEWEGLQTGMVMVNCILDYVLLNSNVTCSKGSVHVLSNLVMISNRLLLISIVLPAPFFSGRNQKVRKKGAIEKFSPKCSNVAI
jgi:hypothetical protein